MEATVIRISGHQGADIRRSGHQSQNPSFLPDFLIPGILRTDFLIA